MSMDMTGKPSAEVSVVAQSEEMFLLRDRVNYRRGQRELLDKIDALKPKEESMLLTEYFIKLSNLLFHERAEIEAAEREDAIE